MKQNKYCLVIEITNARNLNLNLSCKLQEADVTENKAHPAKTCK